MAIKLYTRVFTIILFAFTGLTVFGQENTKMASYAAPDDYFIGGITISGIRYLDPNALISISGLRRGQEIFVPGEEVTTAVKKLQMQGLFSDIKVFYTTSGDTVFLDIQLKERPRISSVNYKGIRKSEETDLLEKIKMPVGSQVADFLLNSSEKIIRDHFIEKGFLNTEVKFIKKDDPDQPNNVILTVDIDKKDKVKIGEITFIGNEYFDDQALRKKLKGTKKKNLNFFRASKFIDEKFEEDKDLLTVFYNDNGFKDFTFLGDSLYRISEDRIGLAIKIDEGSQYFLRNVKWVGNSIYPKEYLEEIFNIEKGSVYNLSLIDEKLHGSPTSEEAIANLYMNNGYLYSNVNAVEAKVEKDSIDLEIRIFEGEQAYINDIIIEGNTRTNEHVARRELYTLPGDLFSRDLIVRSIRQLSVLGHWDPEKINPKPIPDYTSGANTVDIVYQLEEKANDQFEISGGWGAGMLVGTIGVRFNNFAMRNFFDLKEWKPYPSGDGQSLSIRAQSNGKIYQSYNLSFSEPWLGGKKPNNFNASLFRSVMRNADTQSMIVDGGSIGLGKRLSWPDDWFNIYGELSYQRYSLDNYTAYAFLFDNGTSNLASLTARIMRYSTGTNPVYPTQGSSFTLSVQATPPYSSISGKNLRNAPADIKYNWIEFHKWIFKADYYYSITRNTKLVLNSKFNFGYLGYYNKDIGPSPFENFYLGGDGMSGYSLYGREVIALRGYTAGSATPVDKNTNAPAGNVYSKLSFEIRYPLSLNPQATIYGLAFVEAGKAWHSLKEYNPFRMYRSAGVGLRANLPMFGLLGVDWGYGFDAVPNNPNANKSQFHFVIGQQF